VDRLATGLSIARRRGAPVSSVGGMSDDSGSNLGVRGVAALLVIAGLLLMRAAYRIGRGASRLTFPGVAAICGIGVFAAAGAAAIGAGAFLLGAGL